MSRKHSVAWSVMSLFVLAAIASADVKLPAVFGDGMVLQQKSSAAVWGWAAPGEKIDVKASWMKSAKSTKADKDGKWSLNIRTDKAGGPYTLSIKGANEITLNNVLLGEVWVCSGQSNMEFTMAMLKSEPVNADIAKADFPQIRLFTVAKATSGVPLEDVSGQWQVCSPQTVGSFSATAFYFGRKLHEELNVPIGLVSTSWGGTKAEVWMSKESLMKFDQFRDIVKDLGSPESTAAGSKKYEQALADWEQKVGELDAGLKEKWFDPQLDDADWKTMELPTFWEKTELGQMDGIVWFRRTTTLPPSWARTDMELRLGPIDDVATVWFNGVPLGTTFGYNIPRVYRIPQSALRVGKNTIVVRVVDFLADGGFGGSADDMRIGPPGSDVKTAATVARTWKYKVGYSGPVPMSPDQTGNSGKPNHTTPSALYNAMIAPILPMRIAGAIWYQGESNCYDPILYRTLFPALITDWRKQWHQGDFPFYYVQIAPWDYGGTTNSQAIREAQMMTLDAVPNVGMAVTMDIGDEKNIHPKDKVDVGDRLARWALAKDYGRKDLVYSGPIYKSMKVKDDAIQLSFDYINGGLVAKGGDLTDFTIAGEDRKFVPASAVIESDKIVVSSSEVKKPAAVRYGWSNWVKGSLFNNAGLPASSFRTDDWPLQ
ncbi:MAG: hypothetical protein LLF76_14580 [Planctomycetaceae bacterium]|nr:hypothetical protein [Planctomycetaceae bacterium]